MDFVYILRVSERSRAVKRKRTRVSWLVAAAACLVLGGWIAVAGSPSSWAQERVDEGEQQGVTPPSDSEENLETPEQVDVEPVARDEEIAHRLEQILVSTQWFMNPEVRVENGVVFLQGKTLKPEHKDWAGALARRTQDVVAVVNRIAIAEGPLWDISPSLAELRELWRQTIQALPLFAFAMVLLLLTGVATFAAVRIARRLLQRRLTNQLLRGVTEKAIAVPIFLVGLYIVLRVSGLTQLALTVMGGTGIAGIIIGIAFRDIAENFLASLLISMQNPFRAGDLIEVNDNLGYVQKVTSRGTALMTLDGNYIQIPNATIYKSILRNYSANPSIRLDFVVGIGYDTPISQAQEIALHELREHPAVLNDPEPMVLVENLAASTINLRIYFWIDGTQHSKLRVHSSVLRLVVRAFQEADISLPDEAREVIFPQGLPVQILEPDGAPRREAQSQRGKRQADTSAVATAAEGGLQSEAGELQTQVKRSRVPEEGQDLLTS